MELFKRPGDHKDCLLKGTSACAAMNNPECPACELGRAGEEIQAQALEDFAALKVLLPSEGVSGLVNSADCLFCKGAKNPRAYYAICDVAHAEPARTKTSVIGIKVKTRVGSMIPLQIACCKQCRSNFLLRDYIPWLIAAAAAIILIIVLSNVPLRQSLQDVYELLPLLIFIAAFGAAYLAGNIVRNAFVKAKGQKTTFDVFELPTLKKMREMGWFSLYGEDKPVRLIFSKKRLGRGWFSGDHAE